MHDFKKKLTFVFAFLLVVLVVYCNGYIILLYCLHYFNMLNVKIKSLMLGVL